MATAPDMQQVSSCKKNKKSHRRQSGTADPTTANNAAVCGAVGGASTQAPLTRQLEFNQAMADFKTMFPSMDSDVIETVLRANNGAVDATIDQLLTLTADMPDTPQRPQHPELPHYNDAMNPDFSSSSSVMNGNLVSDNPPPYSPPAPNSSFSQEIRSRHLPPTPNQPSPLSNPHQSTPTPMPLHTPSGFPPAAPLHEPTKLTATSRPRHPRWNPPLLGELPADFLRISHPGVARRLSNQQMMVSAKLQERIAQNFQQRNSIDINDVEMQRMLEDERFALTLQNEEFMRELQRNPDFLEALNNDYLNAIESASSSMPTAPVTTQATGATPGTYGQHQATSGQDVASASPQAIGGVRAATGGASNDDVEFRNKLSHMGKTTKYKFAQIAKRFNYKRRRSSSKPQSEDAPAASMMNLLDDYDDSGDCALLGTRPEVEENLYTQTQKPRGQKKQSPEQEEPIIFYQEDDEFTLHVET